MSQIVGSILKDGTITKGSSFCKASKKQTGVYKITFNTPLENVPTILVTPSNDTDVYYVVGATTSNVSANGFTVQIAKFLDPWVEDSKFDFLVIV